MTTRSFLFAATILGILTACGGDGGSGGTNPAPPPPAAAGPSPTCTGAEAFSAVADSTIVVGKAAGAVVAGCAGPLTDIQWTQTAGPTVTLMSAKTQAISFEPPSAATYSFSVTFRDSGGAPRTASVSTVASVPATPAAVLAGVDQAVRKGGSVSLRAWPAVAAGETLTWTQTAGPRPASLDTSDPNRVLFAAPDVAQDTTLVFRVTRTTVAGATDSDDVMVLVENYGQAPADPANTGPYVFSDMHVSRAYAYRPNGPFAGVLVRCTFEANLQYFGAAMNTCPLSTLPFLHQTTGGAVPTVSQIMDRVIVSHDWMGQNFEDFLTTQATDDIKRLFNGVTAIVIGAHVRPSFYYALTGAIHLDADNFWLTAEQRDVIDETPDFRIGLDRDLQYSTVWRYTSTVNGLSQSIFVNFPETSRIPRTQSYLLAESSWLLYHELGHAADFLPYGERARLNASLNQTVWGFIGPLYQSRVLGSDQVSSTFPLTSQEMAALAQVKFAGATATAEQRAYTPDQVATFFAPDGATDDYNYLTTREDTAMVFEEFMMYRNHAWRRDMAITDKIAAGATSATVLVRWGRRGRVGETNIKPRAQMAVNLLAPWVLQADPAAVQNLPAPIPMRPGESWTANLTVPAPLGGPATMQSVRLLDFESDRALLMHGLTGARGMTPNERKLKGVGR